MARKVRLCPEITDPQLRAFLNIVPGIRSFQADLLQAQVLSGEKLVITLPGRDVPVFLHRASHENRPVVFELHGGGFVLGNAEKDDAICQKLAERIDVNVIGVDYRLAPENPYPAALDDVCDVIRYFQDHADKYRMDCSRMAMMGFSGGATLAAAAALRSLRDRTFQLHAQVLHYPYLDATRMPDEKPHYPCDMDPEVMSAFTRLYSREEERGLPYVSPVCASADDLTGMPPELIIPAEFDSLKEEGLQFAENLRKAGVPVYCKVMPDAHHGYIEDAGNEEIYSYTSENVKKTHSPYFRIWADAAMELSAVFLEKHL